MTDDDCNCDGYTTSVYTISIGCISDHGLSTYYTELCASTLAVTFNGGAHREREENKMVRIISWSKFSIKVSLTVSNSIDVDVLKIKFLSVLLIQWNPVNTTTPGPKYSGRNNGVVVLTGFGIKLQPHDFNDVMRN